MSDRATPSDGSSAEGWPSCCFEYKSSPQAVAEARRDVRRALRGRLEGDVVETCELLVSELVTNAVQHAGGSLVSLTVARRRGRVRLEVADESEAVPRERVPGDDDEHGRGMLLVLMLSVDWGVERAAIGKRVWCEVESPRWQGI